eukprot:jgi/Astpho2/5218/Aster-x0244
MCIPTYTVDSFTSEAFKGNPAAVCLLAAPLDDAHLQRIANELNLSETAFVEPVTATTGAFLTHSHFKLRWFTPKSEVPLCGHATLAAAAILSAEIGNTSPRLQFDTKSGTLTVERTAGGYAMQLPLLAPTDGLPDVAGLPEAVAGKLPIRDVVYNKAVTYLLVAVDCSQQQLEALPVPDPQTLLNLHTEGCVCGIILTCAAYWASKMPSKTEFRARQCSPRGGELNVKLLEAGSKVQVLGQAVIMLSGSLRL